MHSLTLIVPEHHRETANRLACALGMDTLPGSTYGVALSATGSAPATHYATHAWATDDFLTRVAGALSGAPLGLDLAPFGITDADVAGILEDLVYAHAPDDQPTFDATIAANNLKRIDDGL
jgi:hypothetical protein